MAQDSLIRIGRGVPGARRPERPKWPLLVVAAATLAGVTALIAVVIFFDQPVEQSPQAVASIMDHRVECATVAHEYEAWLRGRERLESLRIVDPVVAEVYVKMLMDEGEALAHATTGYKGAAEAKLALAAADYNFKLSLVNLELVGSGQVGEPGQTAALQAWTEVEGEYHAYRLAVC